MRVDWVPVSASALVAGSTAIALGSLLLPDADGIEEILQQIERDQALWLAVAVLFFAGAVSMTLGLPSILTLVDRRNGVLGLTGVGVFAVGCLGTAGFAMLLAFFRSLVVTDAVRAPALTGITQEVGLAAFLVGWVAAFYLGELLIAISLLRARSTPRWVPALLLAHVATLPLISLMPMEIGRFAVMLMAIGFAGVGISANNADVR